MHNDLIKTALKRLFTVKGQEGKFFQRGTSDDMAAAFMGTRRMRKARKKLYAKGPKKSSGSPAIRPKTFAEAFKPTAENAVGTVTENRKGERKVLLNNDGLKNVKSGKLPITRRQLLAHEAFHARGPKALRNSETAAHIYGGLKGTKGGIGKKLKAAAEQYNHYSATRPKDARRLPIASGATLGAAAALALAKRRNNAIDRRKKEQGDAFDPKAKKNRRHNYLLYGAGGAYAGGIAGAALSELSAAAGNRQLKRKAGK